MARRVPGTALAWADVPVWLLGTAMVCVWAAPFVWMVSTSLKPPAQVMTRTIEWLPREVTLDNYRKVLTYPIGTWALNSVVVAGVATAAQRPLRRHGRLRAGPDALPRPQPPVRPVPGLDHDPARGGRRAAPDLDDPPRLGQHLPGADPADGRQRHRGLHLPPVLPRLPQGARGRRDRGRRRPRPDLLPHRPAARPRTADRRHRHRLHARLEQLPVAAARHLRRGHEDHAGRHRRLRARGRHPHPARGLRRRRWRR